MIESNIVSGTCITFFSLLNFFHDICVVHEEHFYKQMGCKISKTVLRANWGCRSQIEQCII